jgi:hypothetical protein
MANSLENIPQIVEEVRQHFERFAEQDWKVVSAHVSSTDEVSF